MDTLRKGNPREPTKNRVPGRSRGFVRLYSDFAQRWKMATLGFAGRSIMGGLGLSSRPGSREKSRRGNEVQNVPSAHERWGSCLGSLPIIDLHGRSLEDPREPFHADCSEAHISSPNELGHAHMGASALSRCAIFSCKSFLGNPTLACRPSPGYLHDRSYELKRSAEGEITVHLAK